MARQDLLALTLCFSEITVSPNGLWKQLGALQVEEMTFSDHHEFTEKVANTVPGRVFLKLLTFAL